jgi:hypothetical protein
MAPQNQSRIKIIKVPRKDPLPDKPIKFPPFDNLHLELLEVKKKLKRNLPLVPIKPKIAKKPPIINNNSTSNDKSKATSIGVTAISVAKKINDISNKDLKKDEKELLNSLGSSPRKKKIEKKHNSSSASESDTTRERRKKKSKHSSDKENTPPPTDNEDDVLKDLKEAPLESIVVDDDDDEIQVVLDDDDENLVLDDNDIRASGDEHAAEEEVVNEEDLNDPYAGLSPEERREKETEEYKWRFEILRRKYRQADIPVFNEHSQLEEMKPIYENLVKQLTFDSNIESYKTYLAWGFMGIEFVCTQFIQIDMSGFYKNQMMCMDKYDALLVELGEKSYTKWGSNLPVEVKLIFLILFQAGMFYIAKKMSGTDVANFMRMMSGQPTSSGSSSNGNSSAPKADTPDKPKMRGPSIKIDELKKKYDVKDKSSDEENTKNTRHKRKQQ